MTSVRNACSVDQPSKVQDGDQVMYRREFDERKRRYQAVDIKVMQGVGFEYGELATTQDKTDLENV